MDEEERRRRTVSFGEAKGAWSGMGVRAPPSAAKA